MNRNDRTLLTVLTAGSIVLPMTIGLFADWSAWSWILLSAGLLALTAGIGWQIHEQRERERQWLARDQAAPALHQVTNAPLPSTEADYHVLFSATVHWYPLSERAGISRAAQQGIAVDFILDRARRISATQSPENHVHTQYKIAADLGVQRPDPGQHLVTWADSISLTVPGRDVERLTKLAELRKKESLWEHERGYERNLRSYFSEDVLKSPGSAAVWWFSRHTDDVADTVRRIGDFTQLVAAANNTTVDERFQPYLAGLFDPASGQNDAGEHDLFASSIGTNSQSFHSNGGHPGNPESVFADDIYPNSDDATRRSMLLNDLAKVAEAHGAQHQAMRIRNSADLEACSMHPDTPTEDNPEGSEEGATNDSADIETRSMSPDETDGEQNQLGLDQEREPDA